MTYMNFFKSQFLTKVIGNYKIHHLIIHTQTDEGFHSFFTVTPKNKTSIKIFSSLHEAFKQCTKE